VTPWHLLKLVFLPPVPSPCLLHQFQIAGRVEFAVEVAGVSGIDIDHVWRAQGQRVFQFNPVVDVDSGYMLGFHFIFLVSVVALLVSMKSTGILRSL